MKKNIYLAVCAAFIIFISCANTNNNEYAIDTKHIYVDAEAAKIVKWAVNEFANDIEDITGKRPEIYYTDTVVADNNGIYIGDVNSCFGYKDVSKIKGKWESFHIFNQEKKLFILGSDIRGTVYGIFDLAERIGISPWKWWADVNPAKKSKISFDLPEDGIISSPSVQYRGIFLNDEDWGLQPWAAKTLEPETGDIGPKTYERIFQLLLRLKANTIWPAMHHCTSPFFAVEGNKEMAEKYHIVIGTSHAEPMLRNNVREWDKSKRGAFNYFTNSDNVKQYWQERVNETKNAGNECLFTVGMRGIHDSKMEGCFK